MLNYTALTLHQSNARAVVYLRRVEILPPCLFRVGCPSGTDERYVRRTAKDIKARGEPGGRRARGARPLWPSVVRALFSMGVHLRYDMPEQIQYDPDWF